eukprot:scaffold25258_cov184-Skeletonema_dohrnii-CCMP3373.AAC.9
MTMPCNCNSTTTTTIIVPTKVEDNCSYSASFMRQITGQQQKEFKSKFDAFQHYSSDLLRLKTLLLSDEEDDDELNALAAVNDALRSAGLSDIAAKDASKRRRGNSSQSIKQKESGTPRKTRLSWELHPSLLLHDLYYQVEEDVQSIPDDGDDHEEQQQQATPLSEFKE